MVPCPPQPLVLLALSKDRLYEWIKTQYLWLAGKKVMLVFGDVIAEEGLLK